MVSSAPNTQELNFTHMFDFVDLSSPNREVCLTKNSIYYILYNSKKFTKFLTIILRAGYFSQLNSSQADFTIFAVQDKDLENIPLEYFEKMDDGMARQIIMSSTMNRKIDKVLLKSSPVCYFYTLLPRMRLYATNIGGATTLNNCVNIVEFDIEANNGLIHIVDGLIAPNDDTFMN